MNFAKIVMLSAFFLGAGVFMARGQQVPACGVQLSPQAIYKGEPAKSNGIDQHQPHDCGAPGQWECVEYVKRFYKNVLHVNTTTDAWRGNPRDWVDDPTSPQYFTAKGLIGFMTPSPVPPMPDDILVYKNDDPAQDSDVGHVAIVTNVTSDNKVYVIEQNGSSSGVRLPVPGPHSLSKVNGLYTLDNYATHYKVVAWLRKPSQPTQWLSFVEGNPGVPGDGVFINGNAGNVQLAFELSTPVPLAQFAATGFTYTAFFPTGTPPLRDVQLGISNLQTLGSCQISFEDRPVPSGNTVFNGVPGIFTNVAPADLSAIVTFVNQNSPGCSNVSLNDLYFNHLLLEIANPPSFATTLDAAAVGPGLNNVPLP